MKLRIEKTFRVTEQCSSASRVISEASNVYGPLKASPVLVGREIQTRGTKGIFKSFRGYLVFLSL